MMPPTAVVPVREGLLPIGGVEAVAEAGGRCWLVGSGCADAADELAGIAGDVVIVELGAFDPQRWAPVLASLVTGDGGGEGHLVLPHSPDGRDLAPRLAAALDRPLVSAAVSIGPGSAVVARSGGRTMATIVLDRAVVATFQLGARTPPQPSSDDPPTVTTPVLLPSAGVTDGPNRIDLVEQIPADPATIDLAEATRIVAAGVGIGSEAVVADVEEVAGLLGASVGATRVITDWGWLPAERQIGTTGVTVDPDLYIAVGISGAVQHTAGLGDPAHVIVVNTDASCPMMELADLALVCDGPAFLAALKLRLSAGRDC